ncbi:MAG TPA: ABC transporter ATP-binding protein [Burkholderiales bacterium]|nr:ABC transporter ATP-binding protein [Burkholderiales bacterium]
MLKLRSLRSGYGRIPVLHGIDLEVREGELVALLGANGAGKTTLLRAISGVQPASGSIVLDDAEIQGLSAAERVSLGVVQVPEGRQIFAPLSVEDNLRLGAYRRGRADSSRSLERVYGLFPALAERRDDPAGGLSGGQQQMLALGRALMAQPRLLLLDEPSMGLAPRLVAEIFACIERLRAADTAILLVEQNAVGALAIAARAYVLEAGRVTLSGTGAGLLADPAVRTAYLGI